jgi:hypothetical protein
MLGELIAAFHPRQPAVAQEEVDALRPQRLQGLDTVTGDAGGEASAREHPAEHMARRSVIVYDEDS